MDNRFLTETAAMRTLTFSSPRGDTSFKIGLSLVAIFAAAELFLAGYYYLGKGQAHSTTSTGATLTQPADFPPAATAAPVAVVPAPVVAPAPALLASPSAPAIAADDLLVKEAIDLTNRGDSATALNRLQQATEKNPRNAQAYAEMAKIYETTNNLDRSNEMWRKVQDIGPSSGAVYELADARLKRGVTATPPAPVVTESTPAPAPPTPAASDGIPDGSSFGISELTTTETPDGLEIALDKDTYAAGEVAKLKVSPHFAGELLINIGSDKLLKTVTATVPAGGSTVDIPVGDNWGAGAYVTATLFRPGDAQETRMPARAIGVKWLKVDPGSKKLAVTLTPPDKTMPRP